MSIFKELNLEKGLGLMEGVLEDVCHPVGKVGVFHYCFSYFKEKL